MESGLRGTSEPDLWAVISPLIMGNDYIRLRLVIPAVPCGCEVRTTNRKQPVCLGGLSLFFPDIGGRKWCARLTIPDFFFAVVQAKKTRRAL